MSCTLILAALVAVASPGGSPTPSPSPAATPAPMPPYSVHAAFSAYSIHTDNVNPAGALDTPTGADLTSRTDLSNALITLSKNTGPIQASITAGEYAFPVAGLAIDPTAQSNANTYLYGWIPTFDVAYVPNGYLTISAGQLPALLGQENDFTYQNFDIQRGLVWNAEPVFSRGVRLAYTNRKITGDLEYDDGFYSGDGGRALEGLAGWAPTPDTNWSFAFLIPGANTPPNLTASIANKREFDFMLAQTFGKLQLEPYVLYVVSPSSARLGYTASESALGGVILADYAFNNAYSIGARFESFTDDSAVSDKSPNADLVGYGPGSRATTWTITPEYHPSSFFVRAEYSLVTVSNAAAAFGPGGTFTNQSRYLLEMGVQI